MNKKLLILFGVVLVGTILLVYLSGRPSEPPESAESESAEAPAKKGPSAASPKRLLGSIDPKTRGAAISRIFSHKNSNGVERVVISAHALGGGEDGIFTDEEGRPFSKVDQALMERAIAAFNSDDLDALRAFAKEAIKSANVEVREKAVETLGFYGQQMLPELLPFLSDPSKEVSQAAKDAWLDGLRNMEVDKEKALTAEYMLPALRDEDMIEDVARELVGIDELASLEVIASLLAQGVKGKAEEMLKEVYEDITEEAWTDEEAAENWLQKNYHPNEDENE